MFTSCDIFGFLVFCFLLNSPILVGLSSDILSLLFSRHSDFLPHCDWFHLALVHLTFLVFKGFCCWGESAYTVW